MEADRSKKNILIAPLDWGLGHATRSIPIIRACIDMGHHVVIASSGRSLGLLKKEFPNQICIDLPSYNIYYQKKGSFIFNIIKQLGKVFAGIRRERRMVNQVINDYHIDLIISDNRYGVYHNNIRSIIISHQMMVKLPQARSLEPFVHRWLQWQHKKFDEVWIPDVASDPNIAGDLAHQYKIPKNTKFIGILTRFYKPATTVAVKYDVLAILSGPEPQRTIFEELILEQAKQINLNFVIVKGVSETEIDEMITPHIRLISHLTAQDLFQLVLESDIILSRGGYSTLMDMALLSKKCVFVPTPGQTEQEYLVEELAKKKLVYAAGQDHFDLAGSLEAVKNYPGLMIEADPNEFSTHLVEAISKV